MYGRRMIVLQVLWLLFHLYESAVDSEFSAVSKNQGKLFSVRLPTVHHNHRNYNVINLPKPTKSNADVIVETDKGSVRGYFEESEHGTYYSFLGIPYAEKPVRFQAPTPHPGWSGILDATKPGAPCLQHNRLLKTIMGSEDCLFVNVHTPDPKPETAKLPVFVWIHGGEFRYGTADPRVFGPSKIVTRGVVYVAFGYRLDVFGFLATGTKEAPGNAGLKDVAEALRWVRRNVERFGGDKDNVCLYGISSSAAMIDLLTVSPTAAGLFAKAITQSSISPRLSIDEDYRRRAFDVGRAVGFDAADAANGDPGALVERLRRVDAVELLRAADDASVVDEHELLAYSFRPVVESAIDGVEPFLSERPLAALGEGRVADVPLIVSVTNLEGTFAVREKVDARKYVDSLDDRWETLLTKYVNRTDENRRRVAAQLKSYYLGNNPNGRNKVKRFLSWAGDTGVVYPIRRWLDTRANVTSLTSPVYFWEFAVDSELGKARRLDKLEGIKGSGHGENVPFVFNTSIHNHLIDNETKLAINRTLTLMTNFMKYSDPTPNVTELLPIKWLPYGHEAYCLRLTSKVQLLKNPHKKNMQYLKTVDYDF